MMTNTFSSEKTNGLFPVEILGLDCDDPGALERMLRQEAGPLQQADIICAGKTIFTILGNDPRLAGRLLLLAPPLEPLFEDMAALRRKGMRIIVLADGDPLFYGIGATMGRFMEKGALRIHPAVSCLQAACARLRLPWHNVFCVSLHGRYDFTPIFSALGLDQPICALTCGKCGPDVLARILLDRGVDWLDAHIFEKMGSEGEKYRKMNLEECAASLFAENSTLILTPRAKIRYPAPGMDRDGLLGSCMSKRPVRGAALELLRIYPGNHVWDVGSGSGLLALEACALAYAGKVAAIEQSPERAMDIQVNRAREGAVNLSIYLGHAPDCLCGLDRPDRIFIGGGLSGNDATDLLKYCAEALAPGGRLVVSCVLLESVSICRKFLEALGWPMEMLHIQASFSECFGSGERLVPLNPVFLLAACKP